MDGWVGACLPVLGALPKGAAAGSQHVHAFTRASRHGLQMNTDYEAVHKAYGAAAS